MLKSSNLLIEVTIKIINKRLKDYKITEVLINLEVVENYIFLD